VRVGQLLLVNAEVNIKLRLCLVAGGQHHERLGHALINFERGVGFAAHVHAELEARDAGQRRPVGQVQVGRAHEGRV